MTTAARQRAHRLGHAAEWRAVWRLRLAGFSILARRYKTRLGEIDIVARRGRVLAIVEVKARADRDNAALSLSPGQRLRIERAAQALVARHPQLGVCDLRFDLMLVGRGRWPQHVANAWRPGMV